ncbi:hypothetical protein D9619_013066 [Psilocybe cf. subviscida]|uniref:Uncharacterized protein n=1 Tax=Psilocybe cf. subviscida TaxID=2480587 RepID=A0A8H5AZH2_9AGAR|nr:hypothetical protein D9619_013066 [Psilocybe cf. subviscida]
MQLINNKFISILLAITVSAQSVHSAVIARHALAQVSVIFFDDINVRGASFSPDDLVQGVCTTLPGDWLDRAESVEISAGFSCSFFELQGCEGPATALTGTVDFLDPTVYNNIESFVCTKAL